MNKPTKLVTKLIRGSIKLDAPPMAFDAKLLASQSQLDPFVGRSLVVMKHTRLHALTAPG
jgi:hypothetical protein